MKKHCACGRQFDDASWAELPIVGGMDPEDDEDPTYILEMRNCTCHSTLAVERRMVTDMDSAGPEVLWWLARARRATIDELYRLRNVKKQSLHPPGIAQKPPLP